VWQSGLWCDSSSLGGSNHAPTVAAVCEESVRRERSARGEVCKGPSVFWDAVGCGTLGDHAQRSGPYGATAEPVGRKLGDRQSGRSPEWNPNTEGIIMRNSYSFSHRPDAWAFGVQDTFTTGTDRDAMMRRAQQLRDARDRQNRVGERIQQELDRK
jgi:hypothetical protein